MNTGLSGNVSGDFELGQVTDSQGAATSGSSSSSFDDDSENVWGVQNDDDPYRLSENQDLVLYSVEEERAVVQKLDRRLVIFLAALYLLSFLDRSSK